MQMYFDYEVFTECGIPKVRMIGTSEDWKKLREKVAGIAKFGLDWWIDKLMPIIDKFVSVAVHGESDSNFWNSIGKVVDSGMSGECDRLSGWIINFFPYLSSAKNPYLRDLDDILATMKIITSDKFTQMGYKEVSELFKMIP